MVSRFLIVTAMQFRIGNVASMDTKAHFAEKRKCILIDCRKGNRLNGLSKMGYQVPYTGKFLVGVKPGTKFFRKHQYFSLFLFFE